MTNGTADNIVSSVNGQVVMVKYKDGEQKIIIGPDAKIRMLFPALLTSSSPAPKCLCSRPEKAPDGSLQTTASMWVSATWCPSPLKSLLVLARHLLVLRA